MPQTVDTDPTRPSDPIRGTASPRFRRAAAALGTATAGILGAVLALGLINAAPATAEPDAPAAPAAAVTLPTPVPAEPALARLGVDEESARIRERVVRRAKAQVGDAYVAGAEGPNAFDCSGLTLFAWRAAGVRLTHYSRAQFDETRRVPVRDARPGDLVFYLRAGAHHVGVYIGRGRMVHASDYGIGVIISPILGTGWTDAHFSGIGRVDIPA